MRSVDLLELVDKDLDSSYTFLDLEGSGRVEKIDCWGFSEKEPDEWRGVALESAKKVNFRYGKNPYIGELQGDIKTIEEVRKSYMERVEGTGFPMYYDLERNKEGVIFEMVALFCSAAVGVGLDSFASGGGIFVASHLGNELWRRVKLRRLESDLREVNEGIGRYRNFVKDIRNAEIEIHTSEKVGRMVSEIRKFKENYWDMLLPTGLVNENLKRVYFNP